MFHDELHAPDTYVITGDIPAMWLRVSSAQVQPYIRFAQQDECLARMIKGLVRRHIRCILLDPYANAFTYSPAEISEHASDLTTMKPGVFERKYGSDSLCYTIQLIFRYWSATGDTSILDEDWLSAMHRILEVWRVEQNHLTESGYRFQRQNCPETDTLPDEGKGSPVVFTGMSWSGFRPSDDRCELHYHVPSQAFALVVLGYIAELAATRNQLELLGEANALRAHIQQGLAANATYLHPGSQQTVFAYEVDGFGNAIFMDDANLPSLLSLPWLGYCAGNDPVYLATRALLLSEANPCFVRGELAEGIGSPHTPAGRLWPLSIITRALTSMDDLEIHGCLNSLLTLHGGSRLMHESVDADTPQPFSRSCFAWANSMFAELLFYLAEKRPHILVDFRL